MGLIRAGFYVLVFAAGVYAGVQYERCNLPIKPDTPVCRLEQKIEEHVTSMKDATKQKTDELSQRVGDYASKLKEGYNECVNAVERSFNQ